MIKNRKEINQGMNWIRPAKRLAIYLRDGLACVWCGATVEDGAVLTLDHLKCHSKGGTNDETNLVTACRRCNSSRGNRSVRVFAVAVADYRNVVANRIILNIEVTSRRRLDLLAAKQLIARRGGFVAACRS